MAEWSATPGSTLACKSSRPLHLENRPFELIQGMLLRPESFQQHDNDPSVNQRTLNAQLTCDQGFKGCRNVMLLLTNREYM